MPCKQLPVMQVAGDWLPQNPRRGVPQRDPVRGTDRIKTSLFGDGTLVVLCHGDPGDAARFTLSTDKGLTGPRRGGDGDLREDLREDDDLCP